MLGMAASLFVSGGAWSTEGALAFPGAQGWAATRRVAEAARSFA